MKTLTWVSFAVLYNVPKGVDDCIRVSAHREQGMRSISVSDINRCERERKELVNDCSDFMGVDLIVYQLCIREKDLCYKEK